MDEQSKNSDIISVLTSFLFVVTIVAIALLAIQIKVLKLEDRVVESESQTSDNPSHNQSNGDNGQDNNQSGDGDGEGAAPGSATSAGGGGDGNTGESERADKLGFHPAAGGGGGVERFEPQESGNETEKLETPQSTPMDSGFGDIGESEASKLHEGRASGGGGIGAGHEGGGGGGGGQNQITPPKVNLPEKVKWAVLIIILLAVIGLGAFLVRAHMRARRAALKKRTDAKRGRKKARKPEEPKPEVKELAEEFTEFIELTYDSLASMEDVRKAVALCYVQMSRAIAAKGLVRSPDATPREFLHAVSTTFKVRSKGMRDLTHLFEEAVFSEHKMTEKHRKRALDVLKGLIEEVKRW